MFIFWGTRMYGRKNTVKGWGVCGNCDLYGKNSSYTGRQWGHLYFIPLIPKGPRVRVLKECKKCSHGVQIPEIDIPNVQHDLYTRTKNALAALVAGNEVFDDNGTNVSATAALVDSVEFLFCLQSEKHLLAILSTLKHNKLMYQYYLVEGKMNVFKGKLDDGGASFEQATNYHYRDPIAFMLLGSVQLNKKDYESARGSYEKALALSENRFPVLQILIFIYENLKDNLSLAQTYEECFRVLPQYASDKKVFKAYKKACKKAGLQPMKE